MLIYGYNDKLLGIILMLCQFSRIKVVFVPGGSNTCVAMVSCVYDNIRFGFYLLEWDLNSTRKWLVIPVTYMLLLQLWACVPRLDILVAHKVHS